MRKGKWIAVGGKPYIMYTGTITYTDIVLLGAFDRYEDADQWLADNLEECGGLVQLIFVSEDGDVTYGYEELDVSEEKEETEEESETP